MSQRVDLSRRSPCPRSAPTGSSSWASSAGKLADLARAKPARKSGRANAPRAARGRARDLGIVEAEQQDVGVLRRDQTATWSNTERVGPQHELERAGRLVEVDTTGVDAARREPSRAGLEELAAEEHLDAGHPRVARLRDDHVVARVARAAARGRRRCARSGPSGAARRRGWRSRRAARPRSRRARSRRPSTLFVVVERGELARGDAGAEADHERALVRARRAAPGRAPRAPSWGSRASVFPSDLPFTMMLSVTLAASRAGDHRDRAVRVVVVEEERRQRGARVERAGPAKRPAGCARAARNRPDDEAVASPRRQRAQRRAHRREHAARAATRRPRA